MTIGQIAKTVEKFTIDNSALILTGIGVAGTVATAVFSGRASYKAADYIRHLEDPANPFTVKEKVKLVWPLYISAIGTCTLTVTCIIFANRIDTRRAAAMAAAYTISERAFEDYREKIEEKFGAKKEQDVRDDIARDRVRENPVGKSEVIITGGGDVLCYDLYTGRYFKSDMETLRQAVNDLNETILNHQYASLNDFYNKIGLASTKTGDEVGWNADKLMRVHYATTMSDDNRPCITIDFEVAPVRNYFRAH